MNRLPPEKRAQILTLMVEGMPIRSISRVTGASKNTITKLLVEAGTACSEFQGAALVDLNCKRLQLDEIWSFVYATQKTVSDAFKYHGGFGDVWTWTALDADSKLMVSWLVGNRNGETAKTFICELKMRLRRRVQIATDSLRTYLDAIDYAFGDDVDYAQLEKIYGQPAQSPVACSPPEAIRTDTRCCTERPKPKHISTSFVERQNFGWRRFTPVTNGLSKKVENHIHALSIYFMHYNFVRIHQTTRVTPATAAGVSQTPWSMEDVVRLVDEWPLKREASTAPGVALSSQTDPLPT